MWSKPAAPGAAGLPPVAHGASPAPMCLPGGCATCAVPPHPTPAPSNGRMGSTFPWSCCFARECEEGSGKEREGCREGGEGEWWDLPESSKASREGLNINPMEECVSLQSISKRCPPYSARSVAHPGKQTPISGVQRCLLSPPPSQRADQEQCKCSSSSERAWDTAGQSISPGDRCPRAAAPDLIHLPVNLIQTPATKS